MDNKTKHIYQKFDGKLIGSFPMKVHICRTLAKMPENIIDIITRTCWFMGSMEDAWAFTFTGNDLANQHLIFLSDELLLQNEKQIQFSIAHELGHVLLKHRNSTLVQQTKTEIKKQEEAANGFAKKFIKLDLDDY